MLGRRDTKTSLDVTPQDAEEKARNIDLSQLVTRNSGDEAAFRGWLVGGKFANHRAFTQPLNDLADHLRNLQLDDKVAVIDQAHPLAKVLVLLMTAAEPSSSHPGESAASRMNSLPLQFRPNRFSFEGVCLVKLPESCSSGHAVKADIKWAPGTFSFKWEEETPFGDLVEGRYVPWKKRFWTYLEYHIASFALDGVLRDPKAISDVIKLFSLSIFLVGVATGDMCVMGELPPEAVRWSRSHDAVRSRNNMRLYQSLWTEMAPEIRTKWVESSGCMHFLLCGFAKHIDDMCLNYEREMTYILDVDDGYYHREVAREGLFYLSERKRRKQRFRECRNILLRRIEEVLDASERSTRPVVCHTK